jgi:alcohol dehydrogenase class IV
MSNKEIIKDLAKIAEKNGMKRMLVITDKGILFEDATMELVNDIMLAVNFVMGNMVSEGKLNVDHIPAMFNEYGKIVQGNIKNVMKPC